MASSSKPKRSYDVFLSFRGMDVRNNFLGHLYGALDLLGIYTYKDDKELDKGDRISPALMAAIKDSRMAIIVFSEDYTSSSWCLDEAAEIMDCKQKRGLMVFSVFYKVEPRDVRNPRQKYSEEVSWSFRCFVQWFFRCFMHEWGENLERVKKMRWKEALCNAGSLAGVLMAGLWGQGGIGKTTLAKAVYNDIFRQFEASCFLANVRETSKDCKDLIALETKLLSVLSRNRELVVSSVDAGTNLMQERLWNKKILLVLDDVDDLWQLDALAGEGEWFGKGSRIIITTRDKHLLTVLGIYEHHVYEVKALDGSEARELFTKHASKQGNLIIKKDLVDEVLNYAKGLPLALEVLGSYLCGRNENEWGSALEKLSSFPNRSINDVLKISYDGLEENEKEIFLHVACFFKGHETEYIKKVLESCDFKGIEIGLATLIDRSLITVGGCSTLQMHDLIQFMGRDIAEQECRDPRRRSRLWKYDDVLDVLSDDTVRLLNTSKIELIIT